jgi:hypothetical protein
MHVPFLISPRVVHVQAIPRTVLLDTKTGGTNLLQWPVVEVENLRMSGKSFGTVALARRSVVPLDVGKATQVITAVMSSFAHVVLDRLISLLLADHLVLLHYVSISWTSRPSSRWTRRPWRP